MTPSIVIPLRLIYDHTSVILALEQILLDAPPKILLKLIGPDILAPDAALTYWALLKSKSEKTQIVASAYSGLIGPSALIWLAGDLRIMRPLGWMIIPSKFRLCLFHDLQERIVSHIKPDYDVILGLLNEYIPVAEIQDKKLELRELEQMGLIAGSSLDLFMHDIKPNFPPKTKDQSS